MYKRQVFGADGEVAYPYWSACKMVSTRVLMTVLKMTSLAIWKSCSVVIDRQLGHHQLDMCH